MAHRVNALPALRYVSDCSGGEGATIGLLEIVGKSKARYVKLCKRSLPIYRQIATCVANCFYDFQVIHLASCDYAPACQRFILRNFRPHKFFPDLFTRKQAELSALKPVDLYSAGFPCKAFRPLWLLAAGCYFCCLTYEPFIPRSINRSPIAFLDQCRAVPAST